MEAIELPGRLLQMACSRDADENLAKATWRIREAAARGAQIICLQELFRSQYFCREENAELFDLAEPIPGPSTEALAPLARELGVVIVASLFERRAAGLYHNTAAVIDADGAHPRPLSQDAHSGRSALLREVLFHSRRPGFPQLRYALRPHRRRWSAGTSGIRKARAWRRSAARRFCSIPPPSAGILRRKQQYGAAQLDAWRTIQRAHAIANGIYVAAVNRVGFEGPPEQGLEFWGASFVADPFGQVIAEASHDQEEMLIVECDPARMEEVRRNWPFLRDRRIDAYGPISEPVARLMPRTPRALGFRMPAEWEPHEATWIAWPHNREDWPGKVRAHSVGLRRNRAQAGARRARAHPGAAMTAAEAGRAPHIWAKSARI